MSMGVRVLLFFIAVKEKIRQLPEGSGDTHMKKKRRKDILTSFGMCTKMENDL